MAHRRAPRGAASLISLLIIIAVLLTASVAHAFTPATLWARGFGSTSNDFAMSVAVDGFGNVYVTGYFYNTVDFGGGPLTSAGNEDIVVAKYNPMGVHQWSRRFGSTSNDEAYGISVDVSGNSCITGYFNGTVDFGGGPLTSVGGSDIFVLRLDTNGSHLSSQRFGDVSTDVGYSTAIDGEGGYCVTGYFYGTLDFGGGPLASAGTSDIFVAYYTVGAEHRWSKRFGSAGNDDARRVIIDNPANVILVGAFAGSVDFGGGALVSAGSTDGFVAKFSNAGLHVWSRRFGGISADRSYSVTADQFANLYVCGYFQGTADFGGGGLTSNGQYDIFLARYDVNGVHQWSQHFGGSTIDIGQSVATDAFDNVIITGYMSGDTDFGSGMLTNAGEIDAFVAKFNTSGACQWSQHYGDIHAERGRAVATDAASNVYLVGDYQGTVDFGSGALTNTTTSPVTSDMFVAKLTGALAEPVISSISDVPNDQGRKVKIRFSRAGADDALATIPVTRYVALRRDDPAPAATGAVGRPAPGAQVRGMLASGWTEIGSVNAFGDAAYGIDVPTIGDSTITLGQYYSVFKIRAATDVPTRFYSSPPDSGWSLDNLAPGIPTNFAYAASQLSWDESTAEDFDYFTVYGANTDSFGAATLVDYCVAPSLEPGGAPYAFYYVTATDFSGNEGRPAKVNTLAGAGGTPSSYVLSVSNYPNPFNPRTTVRYTVPSRGEVTVAVYDARGTKVATLVDRVVRGAGAYTIDWDGRANEGAVVSSGVYFARIEHASGTRTKKMVMLK